MTVAVKICGINSPAAFDATVAAGADWLGFVFFPASPRFVTPREAAALTARHQGGPDRVGLFVDPTDDAIAETLDALPLAALQLYAPPDRIAEIAARFALPVWHALGIRAPADLPATTQADRLLIEPRPPATATRPGGNAKRLDLTLLAGFRPTYPWMLAGGLTPTTVAAAITATNAPAVDVSSGVESAPGTKSPELIAAFVEAAKKRQGLCP